VRLSNYLVLKIYFYSELLFFEAAQGHKIKDLSKQCPPLLFSTGEEMEA
jgi:hypothetical protein